MRGASPPRQALWEYYNWTGAVCSVIGSGSAPWTPPDAPQGCESCRAAVSSATAVAPSPGGRWRCLPLRSGDESSCGPLGVPPLSRACLRAAPAPGVDFEPAAGYRDHHRRDPCRVSQDQAEPYPLFNGADLRRRVEQRLTNCAGPQHTKLWIATHLLHTEEGLETGAGYRLGACGARVELATGGTGSPE
ncbi:hypothetical protein NDU88_001313 [Pleurodeles waltl]|uniref:Uncharacterized protein n=1 Tax=Pleurodeles waltl TaxID=8319 RepID=A0AAV7VBB5_PLEWA|nr:hypothetical protein NDU88_001313 [Pleurodeles waltl]